MIVAFMNRHDNLLERSSIMTGQGALLVPLYGCILMLFHPFNEISVSAFTESSSMVSVACGVMLGRAASYGRSPPLKAVMEMYDSSVHSVFNLALVAVGKFLVGAVIVAITKIFLKIVAQALISRLLKILDIKYYTKANDSIFNTGYSNNYRLPPIFANKKKESEDKDNEQEKDRLLRTLAQLKQQQPWNIKHAVNFVTYMEMGFSAYYCNPVFCQYLGLVL